MHCRLEAQITPGGSDCTLESQIAAFRLRFQHGASDCSLDAQIAAWTLSLEAGGLDWSHVAQKVIPTVPAWASLGRPGAACGVRHGVPLTLKIAMRL